ncbi:phospholipid carrier-dependent glycosyltransferase [Stakelama sediminis]|uniref:Polyprenol-phosphate-mannose--protein mannosyltransferase n=1 Tax=Stakelama sediminis TaxID=463200 RepID=A0A840YVM9_9SPHN|nr:phospholipid carrier-dependent glycosyltransferase [Stakelama sediminis]MBB5717594.1 dolichyl-phosphate-mannose--protein O-mannosyl transferase [Stakelama sediminis]
MLDRFRDRPWLAALLIALTAQILFMVHLGRPDVLMFDEVHYVPAARVLLTLDHPVNQEHPLLAKEIIAAGIALFGDKPWGWRFFATLAGTATVAGVFAILWLTFGRLRTAAFGALLVIVNQMVFIQARIAMLDGFMGAFTILAMAAMLWAMRARTGRQTRWRLVLTGVLLGLAVGVKWTAVPYVAFAGMAMIVVRLRNARLSGKGWASVLSSRNQPHWPEIATIPALLIVGLVSIAVYFVTFAPAFFYAHQPLTIATLLPFQIEMWKLQTEVLAAHPYQSQWWSWPLMLRPIWYFYDQDMGSWRGVILLGNPAIMWGGLPALIACLIAWWRGGGLRQLAIVLLWVASLAVWAIIPKSLGFYYYYYLSGIFLCLAIPAAFNHFGKGRWKEADEWFAILALGLFIYFYPVLSAGPLAGRMAFAHWTWFMSWR